MTQEAYITLLIDCMEQLSPKIVIHRLTGDGPGALLIAPLWSQSKRAVLNSLHAELKRRGTGRDAFLLLSPMIHKDNLILLRRTYVGTNYPL
ncbi:MAG: hypothetical protein ACLTSZ_14990 [Lachnospiraceae bacterium]